ncbi:ribonuclease H-like domain-containing protein [Tanacetum coccineum]
MSMHVYTNDEYENFVHSGNDSGTLISKLDVSHPLNLQLNDSVALTIVFVKLKRTENYQVWSCAMLLPLEGKNKTGFINGTCKRSNVDEVSILLKETLPDVKSAYATNSGEESHRVSSGSSFGPSERSQTSAFSDNDNSINKKGVHVNMAGANQHMTYTDKFLVNVIDVSYLEIMVSHPNETKTFITEIGNMPLTESLTLYDVLVILRYYVSLMSVHKVARDSKLILALVEMNCYVVDQDLRAGTDISEITRKPSKTSKHGHENGRVNKSRKPKPEKVKSTVNSSQYGQQKEEAQVSLTWIASLAIRVRSLSDPTAKA